MPNASELGLSEPLGRNSILPPALKAAVDRVKRDKDLAEKSRKPYERRWDEWYGLHRNYRRFVEAHAGSNEAGRDEIIHEGKREFGSELFVPWVFAVIETKTPRLLMNNPRMKVKPKTKALTRERAEGVRLLFQERQAEVDYTLNLIPTCRRALKYGLGVSKNFWDVDVRDSLVLERGGGEGDDPLKRLTARLTGQPQISDRTEVNDGPKNEDVELKDFFWDPVAKDMKTCRFAIHRTWRDLRYIMERVEAREWFPLDFETVRTMGSETDRGMQFQQRAAAMGLQGYETNQGPMHEIWEWHDGEQVVTILDGQIPVQFGEAPFSHGELPFSIFRPTIQENEFVGIGEIEPIVHLQNELNTMRSLRLDNSMLLVQKAFFYAEGLVDPADLIVGPGTGIPVDGGSIDDAIRPINFGDLPSSSYREEEALKADIQLAVGMNETVAGAGGPVAETATGEQLVQAALDTRVEMQAKILAQEMVKRDARQWLELWKQHTLVEPREVLVEQTGGWQFLEVTGEDLDLVRVVEPEEDSLAPENGPQKRNDALALSNQLAGNIVIDERKRVRHLLDAFDVPDAESWILPEQTQMNPQVAQTVGEAMKMTLVEAGMKEEQADEIALAAMEQAMGAAGISAPAGELPPGSNGAGPSQPQPAPAEA